MTTYSGTLKRSRRDAWFRENGPCIACGSWDNLQVDHKNPSEKDPALRKQGSGNIWYWPEVRRIAELSKCVVRCYNCHIIKSKSEHAVGENNGSSKLTKEDVMVIRKSYSVGNRTQHVLAREYGVSRSAINEIINRRTWKHL